MPNNDWYEYTSEEMQQLGEEPRDIFGLIMHDRETGGCQYTEPKDALTTDTGKQTGNAFTRQADVAQASHTYQDWQAMIALHMWQPQPADLQQTRETDAFTNRREAT